MEAHKSGAQRLAVLIACYNRREITLRCIEAISAMASNKIGLRVILVDDGSTDGTSEAVKARFPDVVVLPGAGNLFWGGAMHMAFAHAMAQDFDYYLWLNDDTLLAPRVLDQLLETHQAAAHTLGPETIVVGAVSEPDSDELSYGGWRSRTAGKWPFTWASWEKQAPDAERWTECATMNGNCVLIPASVARRVGNLDLRFKHVGGDLDYGLRAVGHGCRIVMAAGYVGVCKTHLGPAPWENPRRSLMERWRQLIGPKGFPFKGWLAFTWRHKGHLWFIPWLAPYILFWLRSPLLRGKAKK